MKKFFLFMTAAAVMLLAGCSETDKAEDKLPDSSGTEGTVQLANPIIDYEDSTSLEAAVGIRIEAPDGAEEISYSSILDETAQVRFTYAEASCTLRASLSLTGTELHGMYYDESDYGELEFNGTILGVTFFGENGTVIAWTANEINYALTVAADLTNDEALAFYRVMTE